MSKIRYHDLAQMEIGKYLQLGDTIFTKIPEILREGSGWLDLPGKELWVNNHPPEYLPATCPGGIDWNLSVYALHKTGLPILGAEYARFCKIQGKGPHWAPRAIPELLDYLEFFQIVGCKDFFFVEPDGIPFSIPCGFFIESESLTEDAANAFNLKRQWELSQLNNLIFVDEKMGRLGLRFPQVRFPHSMFAKLHASLIGHNIRISPELDFFLELATELHDGALIPDTEALKPLDFNRLDEDNNFKRIFSLNPDGWREFRRKYPYFSTGITTRIVQDEHFLSPVRDLADKAAYVAVDAQNLKKLHELTPHLVSLAPNLQRAYEMICRYPSICSIWDSVDIAGEKIFLTDPENFFRFSTLRALLFSGLYHNHFLRSRGTITTNVIFNFRYDRERHPDQLRLATDTDLHQAIAEYLQVSPGFVRSLAARKARVEQFKTRREALARENQLVKNKKIVFTMLEDLTDKANPATDFLVQDQYGQILPFSKAFPKEAAEIGKIMSLKRPVAVLWMDNPREIRPEILEEIYNFRLQEIKRRIYEKK